MHNNQKIYADYNSINRHVVDKRAVFLFLRVQRNVRSFNTPPKYDPNGRQPISVDGPKI